MNDLISIIIPVKNDSRIKKTIDSLLLQDSNLNFEIIVVDSSNGNLKNIKDKFSKHVRWFDYQSKDSNKRSTVAQINFGVDHAKGNIFAFIDADCIAESHWLRELTKPILSEDESFTAGLVKSLKTISQLDEVWTNFAKTKYIDYCPNMNSCFRRELLKTVGKYDEESFNYGWDMDFSWRVIDKGYKIRFVKNAIIFHDWGNLNADIKRNYNYGKAKITLYTKHKDRIKKAIGTDPFAIKYPVLILAIPFLLVLHPLFWIIWIYLVLKDSFKGNIVTTILSNFAYGWGILIGLLMKIFRV